MNAKLFSRKNADFAKKHRIGKAYDIMSISAVAFVQTVIMRMAT